MAQPSFLFESEGLLTIKRVPTVLSNYQKEETDQESGNRQQLSFSRGFLNGANLSLYAFNRIDKVDRVGDSSPSFFETLLLGEWEDRMKRGLFRYDVTICETKLIEGDYGFIAQLNEGRHLKKRPTEFRVDKVLQPFDDSKFNFTKVGQEEFLFQFQPTDGSPTEFIRNAPVNAYTSPSVIAINVSPIEYGHVLLIPRVLDHLPQRIDHDSFLLALYMAAESSNPFFRLGYNSLGAFATVNHLHFQAYFLNKTFPVEKAATKELVTTDKGVKISSLCDYPVRGFVFEGGKTLHDLSSSVSSSCILLQKNNISFNILISDCGRRNFLFPQCYAAKQAMGVVTKELLDTEVNPAVWEISGHVVLKKKNHYEVASEESVVRLLAEVSLSESMFQAVTFAIIGHGHSCSGTSATFELDECGRLDGLSSLVLCPSLKMKVMLLSLHFHEYIIEWFGISHILELGLED